MDRNRQALLVHQNLRLRDSNLAHKGGALLRRRAR